MSQQNLKRLGQPQTWDRSRQRAAGKLFDASGRLNPTLTELEDRIAALEVRFTDEFEQLKALLVALASNTDAQ